MDEKLQRILKNEYCAEPAEPVNGFFLLNNIIKQIILGFWKEGGGFKSLKVTLGRVKCSER